MYSHTLRLRFDYRFADNFRTQNTSCFISSRLMQTNTLTNPSLIMSPHFWDESHCVITIIKCLTLFVGNRRNQQHSRPHSTAKQAENRTQVLKILLLNVIRPTTLLEHDTQSFCIDLNSVLPSKGRSIPRIDFLLERIGVQEAKYFCTLDLTAGYHWIAVSPESALNAACNTD